MLLSEYEQKESKKICLYGRAKVGKTALALQLARIGKLWWFDFEDGIKTGLNEKILPRQFWSNIHLFRIPSSQRIPMGIETMLKVIKGGPTVICWNHGKVDCQACRLASAPTDTICLQKFTLDDWLVMDSITQLSADANAAVLKTIFADADDPEDFVLDKNTGGKDFKYPMAVSFMLDRIFSTIQSGNFNCITISHEVMTEQTKDTGRIPGKGENQPSDNVERIFPAAGSRNFSRNYGRYFDALIHVDVMNGRHRASSSTTYSNVYQTGSRLSRNIEEIMGPDGKTPLPPHEAIVKLFERKQNATTSAIVASSNGSSTSKVG